MRGGSGGRRLRPPERFTSPTLTPRRSERQRTEPCDRRSTSRELHHRFKTQPQNSSEARILFMEYMYRLEKITKTQPPKFERSENFAYGKYRHLIMLKNQPQNSSEARILLMEYIDLKRFKNQPPKFERSENFAYGLYILEKIKPSPNI